MTPLTTSDNCDHLIFIHSVKENVKLPQQIIMVVVSLCSCSLNAD